MGRSLGWCVYCGVFLLGNSVLRCCCCFVVNIYAMFYEDVCVLFGSRDSTVLCEQGYMCAKEAYSVMCECFIVHHSFLFCFRVCYL